MVALATLSQSMPGSSLVGFIIFLHGHFFKFSYFDEFVSKNSGALDIAFYTILIIFVLFPMENKSFEFYQVLRIPCKVCVKLKTTWTKSARSCIG